MLELKVREEHKVSLRSLPRTGSTACLGSSKGSQESLRFPLKGSLEGDIDIGRAVI